MTKKIARVVNLGETYPDVLFEVLGNTSGFIHYDKSVNRDFLRSAQSANAAIVFFKRLNCRIPGALSCSNYINCAKKRRQPRFDRCSRWILIISRWVSLTVTLELGILTSLGITVTWVNG